MRRLPIYVLIDTSGSMRGEPIESVRVGLDAMVSSLRRDPYALETVWLSAISFDREARVLVPLTDIGDFVVPVLKPPTTSPTNMGEALELLFERYRAEVRVSTPNEKGDWLPLLVLMTDGSPSDTQKFNRAVETIGRFKFEKIIACAAGPKAKTEPLKRLTNDVYVLETMDAATFGKFWSWVSAKVESAGRDLGAMNGLSSDSSFALPPPTEETVSDDELPPCDGEDFQMFL